MYKQGKTNGEIRKIYPAHRSTIWLYTLSPKRRMEVLHTKQRAVPTHCKCGIHYKEHLRCPRCTKLIHEVNECQCDISPIIKKYDKEALYQFTVKAVLGELK